jgi:hypothetical protein
LRDYVDVDELFALGMSSVKLADIRAIKAVELRQKFTATDRDEGRCHRGQDAPARRAAETGEAFAQLLAEALLDAGRPDAVPMFERALFRISNRALSVLGLARAHAKLGNVARSKQHYQQLLTMWHAADAGLPATAMTRGCRMKIMLSLLGTSREAQCGNRCGQERGHGDTDRFVEY